MSDCVEHSAPEPVFAEPWHAQVFALTVHLNETGRFAWPDWAERFSATLKRHGLSRELDGGDDYFHAWLETLEAVLDEDGGALKGEVSPIKEAWEEAYLTTPHGAPVSLDV
ncbi:nitrile hydratase accessory protein [Tropicibacter sp. R16_0]|uniref:nitrile hydratase accessory protein n=1 Tax=Tropicibacter sp. R16_0 TaxID=2821102 RepID=UPI001ADAC0EE|nr:nitrile hydratase accessory protein [Tropicibacter sp. R16_0]MBO9450024.1 nitrile hydratase accessory protein [Tropicibacter sp. R16_0]